MSERSERTDMSERSERTDWHSAEPRGGAERLVKPMRRRVSAQMPAGQHGARRVVEEIVTALLHGLHAHVPDGHAAIDVELIDDAQAIRFTLRDDARELPAVLEELPQRPVMAAL